MKKDTITELHLVKQLMKNHSKIIYRISKTSTVKSELLCLKSNPNLNEYIFIKLCKE